MQAIAAELTTLMRADGASILDVVHGLANGAEQSAEALVFMSATGLCAAQVGSRLEVHNTFAGRAVREGRVVRCDDAWEEPEPGLDLSACRADGARSLMAASMSHGDRISWVLQLAAERPRAFSARDEAILDLLRGLCAGVLGRAKEAEQKQEALLALARSEENWKTAFERSAIGMALVSPQGRWLQVNPVLCEILGYSPRELLATTFQAVTHPDDLEWDLSQVERLLDGAGDSYEIEKRYIRPDGSAVWTLLDVSLVRENSGEKSGEAAGAPKYFISQVQDISHRKAAEAERETALAALRRSETLKTAIVETALDCIVIMDAAGDIVEWNPAAEKTFGWPRSQVLGRRLHDVIVPPDLREAHRRGLERFLATGEGPALGRRIEMPALRADGSHIIVEMAVVPIPNYDPPIFSGHLRDITRRRENEDALRESEARYGRIAANVPGMVYQFVLRPDGSTAFPFVSAGSREIYGIEPVQIMRDPNIITDLVVPEDTADFKSSVAASAATMRPWRWEGRVRTPAGEEKWLQGQARPRREDNGDVMWDGLLLDVTAHKTTEAEILCAREEAEAARAEAERARAEAEAARAEAEAAREEAVAANVAKSEFLSRMSHELRTPLNAILGFGQLLQRARLERPHSGSAEQIVKAGGHLLNLINEVLDIAAIEAGGISLSLEPVPVGLLCGEALSLVRPLANQRGIHLHDSPAHGGPTGTLSVHADRQRLNQILLNLLSNAIKYNQPNGEVWIICEERPAPRKNASGEPNAPMLRLGVRDSGPGIAPDEQSRLWQAFDRLGREKEGSEGTGIGLILSRRLAEAMGGTLEVESTPGQGATFWIELPLAHAPVLPPAVAAETEAVSSTADPTADRRTILHIEDNLLNVQLLERVLLERPHIEMITAMQGSLGLEMALQHRPDLILLDLHLPEMSGAEVLRRVREDERTRAIPVVILSADATPGQIERLLAAGAQAYLTKPFQIPALLKTLDAHLAANPPPESS
jgi:PAS domain S-box-containing protein